MEGDDVVSAAAPVAMEPVDAAALGAGGNLGMSDLLDTNLPPAPFEALAAAVLQERRQVTRLFHPEPPYELFDLGNGVRATVSQGPAGYQLDTGETITDF